MFSTFLGPIVLAPAELPSPLMERCDLKTWSAKSPLLVAFGVVGQAASVCYSVENHDVLLEARG